MPAQIPARLGSSIEYEYDYESPSTFCTAEYEY